MNDNKFKTILFDAESTLFSDRIKRHTVYLNAAIEYGATELDIDFVDAELARASVSLANIVDNNVPFSREWWLTYNSMVFCALGLSKKNAAKASKSVVTYFSKADAYDVYPEVVEVLKSLAASGVQLGIMANWCEDLPVLIKRLKLEKHFDFVVASAELRAEKPDRAIFDRVLFRCGVAAENALHIGADFDRDIQGALDAGMHALLIDRNDNVESTLHEGVKVINSLYDVLDICELTAHGL
ncbi:MAG: putative hydrolase of the HAD superfamily [Myxococcota bacterium]|jgi:putative hydrolase of the HAD superfamily